jgi:geranylgeranyl diphosphate synthase type I
MRLTVQGFPPSVGRPLAGPLVANVLGEVCPGAAYGASWNAPMDRSTKATNALELVAGVRRAVDERLEELLRECEATAAEAGEEPRAIAGALAELVRRGGKRLRPALLAAAARACGRATDSAVIDAGCAWELLQAYFLVHDDWMDGDATRRGGPAVHVMLAARHRDDHLGASLAVLAGDLACAIAHRVLASTDAPRDALVTFARVHEQVVLGQALDLTLAAHDARAVERMHALKTGSYTTRGPIELGAILAGASSEQRRALVGFASPLGIAFQLRDDLLGAFGTEAETGKPVGSDIRARKRTALVAEALGRASPDDRAALERWLGGGTPSDVEIEGTLAVLERSGARAAIEARVSALFAEARDALRTATFDRDGLAVLDALAIALVERRS